MDDNGKYTDMKATVTDGNIEFKTTHFSKYLITTDGSLDNTTSKAPDTGFAGGMVLGLIALAGAAVIVSRKKTR